MNKIVLLGALLVLSTTFFNPNIVNAVPFGSNIITNGNAEDGAASPTGVTVVPVQSWTTTGNFTVVSYSLGSGFPTTADPGPSDRGANFFAGGPGNVASSASQVIDLSSSAVDIDTGSVLFDLSGFLGGFNSQGDNAMFTATFKDAGGSILEVFSIGPVTAADRGNTTGLLSRSTSGSVAIGARTVELDLQMTRLEGEYNDGYADNLSLVLTNGPTPVEGIQRTIVYNRITDFSTDQGIQNMKMNDDGSKIAYETSSSKIFTVNTDGTGLTEVFDFNAFRSNFGVKFIDIDADGSRVIWTDGTQEIFVANSDGSNRVRVATTFARPDGGTIAPNFDSQSPRITADGSQVYFVNDLPTPGKLFEKGITDEIGGVWRVNADGTGQEQLFSERQILNDVFGEGSDILFRGGFDISDNGQRIVFGSFDGTTIAFDGSNLRKVAGLGTKDSISISGNGSKIAFIDLNGEGDLFSMNFDGSNQIELLRDIGFSGVLQLNSDGSKVIAKDTGRAGQLTPISLFNTDGSNRVNLVTVDCLDFLIGFNSSESFFPTITGDGKRFAFVSESIPPQIWVADIDPKSTGKAPTVFDVKFSPDFVLEDGSTVSTFTANVSGGDGGINGVCFDSFKDGVFKFVDLEPQNLLDDGTSGDITAGDGTFTNNSVGNSRGTVGSLTIRVAAVDNTLRNITAVDAGPFSILDKAPACTYSITPTSVSFDSSGGSGSVSVGTASGCSWTATSNASWITITTNGSGVGDGIVSYIVSDNIGASKRSGTITIKDQTFTVTQSGTSVGSGNPVPDIKANNSDGPLTLSSDQILNVTVALGPGSQIGTNEDWWVVVNTSFPPPNDWFYFNLSGGWLPGIVVTHQGPLFDLAPFAVLNMTGLPTGTYTFYFGVDTVVNGSPDMGNINFDTVQVDITQ